MKNPLILEIKGNSLDDGRGIRSVVFFKGCPLSCVWCHNPESKKMDAEIAFDAKECAGCDTCLETCPEKALSRDNPYFVDRSRCTLCFKCTDACPSGALSRIGKRMSVDEIAARIIPDKPFFDTSGGGVTLSGGEPTLFMEFAGELAETLTQNGIHVLLETCGLFDFNKFREHLYPYLDEIYFDIKLMDDALHRQHCGVGNELIIENFKKIHKASQNGGIPVTPRTPLIPGITDTMRNMQAIAGFLVSCGADQARLLPYHPLWREKNRKIGIRPQTGNQPAMDRWLDKPALEQCRSVFTKAGIKL